MVHRQGANHSHSADNDLGITIALVTTTHVCINEPIIATWLHRYTECEISCTIVINTQMCKKQPQRVPMSGVMLTGMTAHRRVLIVTNAITINVVGRDDIENFTTRLSGGSTTR